MSVPDVLVEFSPSTDPFDPPVWEDITAPMQTFVIDRGKNRPLDRAETGVATLTFDNLNGRFDPNNALGPYYPGLRPMRRVRITAIIDTGLLPFDVGGSFVGDVDVLGSGIELISMFSGFVETWTQTWAPEPSATPVPTATLRAVDAFKILASAPGVLGIADRSGIVVGLLLDTAKWPAADRNLELGSYNVSSTASLDTNVLAQIQELDASEGGLFFVARDGKITFFGADHVLRNPPDSSQLWGDLLTERQYQSITLATDESVIWNDILITSAFAVSPVQPIVDSISKARYLARPFSLATALMNTTDMEARGWFYLAQFSTPRQRITSLEVGIRDDVEWHDILTHDIQDRIIVRRRPIAGQVIEQDSVIERISMTSNGRYRSWSVIWTLSATPTVNQLTPNQSSLEFGNTTGWVAVTNCSISYVTTTPEYGIGALLLTATANGDISAATTPNTQLAVVPGKTYSAMASFFAQLFLKTGHVEITWRDSGGAVISSSVGSPAVEGTEYQGSAVTAVAPVGAAFATVLVVITNADAGTGHHVENVGFVEGEQTGWSFGVGT